MPDLPFRGRRRLQGSHRPQLWARGCWGTEGTRRNIGPPVPPATSPLGFLRTGSLLRASRYFPLPSSHQGVGEATSSVL